MSSVNAERYEGRSKSGSNSASMLKVQSGQRLESLKVLFRGSPATSSLVGHSLEASLAKGHPHKFLANRDRLRVLCKRFLGKQDRTLCNTHETSTAGASTSLVI